MMTVTRDQNSESVSATSSSPQNETEAEKLARERFAEYFKEVPLDPELKMYLRRLGAKGWQCIQHPLVYAVPYTPNTNNMYNKQLEWKKQMLEEAKSSGNLRAWVFAHERPYRLDAFRRWPLPMTDQDYWETLGAIWSDSENIWQHLSQWKIYLSSSRPGKEWFMDEEEREAFEKLPENLTIYRGYQKWRNKRGLSWTLNKDKAVWFSRRFVTRERRDKAAVDRRVVPKSSVFAYLTGRGEEEIILVPSAAVEKSK